jgi:septum site-determining protein MinC
MSSLISIKGSREGLRLHLDETVALGDVLDALKLQLERGSQFFNGARVVVDIGERMLVGDELAEVLELMRRHGLQADALISSSRESRTAARSAGLAARPLVRAATEAEERSDSTFMQRTVRSGQVVRHQGHVTILGDVNPGAEIVAGGSIIVWGRVRGTVHAGALGDRAAVICALDLQPTQIRIADLIARAPDGPGERGPLIARILGDQISVGGWDSKR